MYLLKPTGQFWNEQLCQIERRAKNLCSYGNHCEVQPPVRYLSHQPDMGAVPSQVQAPDVPPIQPDLQEHRAKLRDLANF